MSSNYKAELRTWKAQCREIAEKAGKLGVKPVLPPRPMLPRSIVLDEKTTPRGTGHLSSETRLARRARRVANRDRADKQADESGYVPPPHIAQMAQALLKELEPAFDAAVERVLARRAPKMRK